MPGCYGGIAPPPGRRAVAGLTLLLFGFVIPVNFPLSTGLLFLPIAFLIMAGVVRGGATVWRLVGLGAVAFLSALYRWDWISFTAIAELLGAGLASLGVALIPQLAQRSEILREGIRRLFLCALVLLCGTFLAAAAVAVTAYSSGALLNAFQFILYIPLHILPYRHLPLSIHNIKDAQWVLNLIAMLALTWAAWKRPLRTRENSGYLSLFEMAYWLVPCVALMPYAFGRADILHYAPLTTMLMMVCLGALSFWGDRKDARLLHAALLVVSLLPLLVSLNIFYKSRQYHAADVGFRHQSQELAACTSLFPQHAKSLFVGQAKYQRFTVNFPIIYLMRPDLLPATPYISDEPGLQNSCSYGSQVAARLLAAPRPLVLILDEDPWPAENDAMRSMTSCGKVEAAIAAMQPEALGTCHILARELRVFVKR